MSYKFELAQHFAKHHPHTAARLLEDMAPVAAMDFIDAMSDQNSAEILASMLPYPAAKCISKLSDTDAAKHISALELKTATRILRHMSKDKREHILGKLPWRIAARVSLILNYSLSTVGAWIEPAVLTLPLDCTVCKARERLRNEEYPDYHRIYVVDKMHHLKGFVSLAALIQADDEKGVLSSELKPVSSVLSANATLKMTANDSGWQNNDYLPVVDRQGRFLGVLRHATLQAVITSPRPGGKEQVPSETFLDLAETCYLGLASVLSTSLAVRKPLTERGSQ